nr:hypothetical protein [Tanacetum cinerariifolium]
MSSNNAPLAVTYTSISSDSDEPSWDIPLMNVDVLSEMDPYEEVTQQRHAPPLSPAYVPDPMELDEHVPVYLLDPEHAEYHVPSNDDRQVEDQPYVDDASPIAESPGHIADLDSMEEDSIDYPNEPEDNDEDPKEDPEEDHTDYPADGGDVPVVDPVPSARDTKAIETDESAHTPRSPQTRILFYQTHLRKARKTVRLEPPMSASMVACAAEHAIPIPPTSPAYDQAPLGHRSAMIRIRDGIPEEDMPPRRIFILTAPLAGWFDYSPGYDARTIARATKKAEEVGYVRALQASEHRMMTLVKEVNLRIRYQEQVRRQESEDFYIQLHDARTDRKDIRLEIDVMLETHMIRMEWQRQSVEDLAVRKMMCIHVLDAIAQIDTVEDTGSSWCEGMETKFKKSEVVAKLLDVVAKVLGVTKEGYEVAT